VPLLSVVVLAWEQAELTRECAEAVRRHTVSPHELIVVDNGSGPAARQVARDSADVTVQHDANLGFAAGMNAGLRRATGPFVAFLNNDAFVPPGWDRPLIEAFDAAGTGIAVPAVTAAGNALTVRSAPSDRVTVLPPFRAVPSGVLYLMRTAAMRELGGWDERFSPAGAEDADLCFRIWVNGLDVVLDERVLVRHVGKASVVQLDDVPAVWARNRRALLRKWRGTEPGATRLATCPPERFAARRRTARLVAAAMTLYFATFAHLPGPARRALLRALRPVAAGAAHRLARPATSRST
jgi:GT2 family glycosyltransferase